jgi:hypothetical protein
MYAFTIESIKKTKCWINGIRTHLDFPASESFQRKAYFISFKGWVASLNEEVDEIYLSWLDNRIVSAQLIPRVDVQQAYPESKNVVGFDLEIAPIVCGGDEPLQVILTTKDGRSSPLFEIFLRFDKDRIQTDATASKPPTFSLIVASGRCGTTLLAQLLLRSKAVSGLDEYPYESHLASRLSMKWFTERQPANYRAMGDGESPDQGLGAIYPILVNCAGDTQRIEAIEALTERTRQQARDEITHLYQILAPQKASSVIVEKFDAASQLGLYFIRDLFSDFRPIFLIRDPRDIILSVRSFNEKRGHYGFHEGNALQFSSQVLSLAGILRRLERYYDHLDGPKMLVKYEDLVRNPTGVIQQVFGFLGINHSPQEIAKLLTGCPIQETHLTSFSPEASIGRWKHELTQSQKEEVNWILQPAISRFGY